MFTSDTWKTFLASNACPMIQKQLNLVKEWGKYWKLFDDKHMFGDGWFNLTSLSSFFWEISHKCKQQQKKTKLTNCGI